MDDERAAARTEQARIDAELVERARGSDPDAFGELYDRWFDRVHDLAFRITRDSSIAPEVAQDAFVAAWQGLPKLEKPEAFGGWLLRIARNGALNRRRKELRATPRDTEGMAVIEATTAPRPNSPAGFRVEDRTTGADDPVRAVEDSEIADLVWESADALGERDAEVLDLTLRHGLTPAEIGDVMGINRNAANQTVHRVRGRLKAAVEARVLWRGGEPVCGDLADALQAAGVTSFGSDAVRVATEHASSCEQCAGRRALKLEPSALFAATPFLAVPLLKARVAHALSEEGVPMGATPPEAPGDEPPGPDGSDARPRRRALRRTVAGLAVMVLAIGVVVAVAEEVDEAAPRARLDVAERPTTTTTLAPGVLPSVEGTTTTTQPLPAPPPLPPPAPPVSASVSIVPSSRPTGNLTVPVLSWSTTGASAVEVSGPGGFASAAPAGSQQVCPGAFVAGGCQAGPGSYQYTIRAFNVYGVLAAEQSVVFTQA